MAHLRSRFLAEKLNKSLKQSPTLSLLGMRQTGKTTLLKEICNSYVTLDDDRTLNQFKQGNWTFLEQLPCPVGIDECQKLPALFDRIKFLVDQKKQMGRYILTGSVRFLSKRQIKESLTGRTLTLELLPLTLSEAHQKKQGDIIKALLHSKTLADFEAYRRPLYTFSKTQIDSHLELGGLPGICLKRDPALRRDLFDQQIETLLSRDLPLLYDTKMSLTKLKLLLKELALIQGLDFSTESLARKISTSSPTLKSVIDAFEGLFLIRRVGKRVYLEDGGISHSLVPNSVLSPLQLYRSFVFRELLALIRYQYPRSTEITSYKTRGGVDIPFVLDVEGRKIAILVDYEPFVTEKTLKSLGKFSKRFRSSRIVVFYLGQSTFEASNGVWCIPLTSLA